MMNRRTFATTTGGIALAALTGGALTRAADEKGTDPVTALRSGPSGLVTVERTIENTRAEETLFEVWFRVYDEDDELLNDKVTFVTIEAAGERTIEQAIPADHEEAAYYTTSVDRVE